MSLVKKTLPVGIDIVIDGLQEELYTGLTAKGWTDYESYPRTYKNETKEGLIPETYTDKGEYKEVYFDDKFNATSFWIAEDVKTQDNDPRFKVNIKVIFQVKLNKLYPTITHRADEEMHKDISSILGNSYVVDRYNTKITTGIKKIYNDEGLISTKGFEDMSNYHVVKFDIGVDYAFACNPSNNLPIQNDYVQVHNSDFAYNVNVTNGGILPLPNIDFTDSDGTTTSVPSMEDIVAKACDIPVIDYLVRFIDYDGTILKEQYVENGTAATAPTIPTHDLITFNAWNRDFSNVTHNEDVGATYDINDNSSRLFISLNDITGLNVTIKIIKSDTNLMTLHWGDGTTSTSSASGNVTFIKAATYPTNGDYVIKLDTTGVFSLGQSSQVSGSAAAQVIFTSVWINQPIGGNNISFYQAYNIKTVLFAEGVTELITNSFNSSRGLISVTLPTSFNTLGTGSFNTCDALQTVCTPQSLNYSTGNSIFNNCHSLRRVTYPMASGAVMSSVVVGCKSLVELVMNGNYTSVASSCFKNSNSLEYIRIPDNCTTFGTSAFSFIYNIISLIMPPVLQSIGANCFQEAKSLTALDFPNTLTVVGNAAFYKCHNIIDYQFASVIPPTLSGTIAFYEINTFCKIYVPDASVAAYKAATNWTLVADYIYPISTRPI